MSQSPNDDPLLASLPSLPDGFKIISGVRIIKKIGQGGMGAVYAGQHTALDIKVALKILPSHLADQNKSFIERFVREARTAAKIDHPNLIRVINVGNEAGVYFLVMEFVDGYSAMDLLEEKGTLSERHALEIALGAAHGLRAAHEKRIIHRDMKPDNIMIRAEDGRVKIADLGLAKETGDVDAAAQDAADAMGLTASGAALGTPYYMPPEQAMDAKSADHRADIYSLGATLYHLLCGAPPFEASSLLPLLMKIRDERPAPLKSKRPDIQDITSQITSKCMEKNPDDRYQSLTEMIVDLEKALDNASGDGGGFGVAGTAIGTVGGGGSAPGLTNTLASVPDMPRPSEPGFEVTLSLNQTATPGSAASSPAPSGVASKTTVDDAPRTAKDIAAVAGNDASSKGNAIPLIIGALVLVAIIIGVALLLTSDKPDAGKTAVTPVAPVNNDEPPIVPTTPATTTTTPTTTTTTTTTPVDNKPNDPETPNNGRPSDRRDDNPARVAERQFSALLDVARETILNEDFVSAKFKLDALATASDAPTRVKLEAKEHLAKVTKYIDNIEAADRAFEKKNFSEAKQWYGKAEDIYPTQVVRDKIQAVDSAVNAQTAERLESAKNAFSKELDAAAMEMDGGRLAAAQTRLQTLLNEPFAADAPEDLRQRARNTMAQLSERIQLEAVRESTVQLEKERAEALAATSRRIFDEAVAKCQAGDPVSAKFQFQALLDAAGAPVDIVASSRENLSKIATYETHIAAGDAALAAQSPDSAAASYESARALFDGEQVKAKLAAVDALRQTIAERNQAAELKRKLIEQALADAEVAVASGRSDDAKRLIETILSSADATPALKASATALRSRITAVETDIAAFQSYLNQYAGRFDDRTLTVQTRNMDIERRIAFIKAYPAHPLADQALLPALVASNVSGAEIKLNGVPAGRTAGVNAPVVVWYDARTPSVITVGKTDMETVSVASKETEGLNLFSRDKLLLDPAQKGTWSFIPESRPVTGLCALNQTLFCGLASGGVLFVNPATGANGVVSAADGTLVSEPVIESGSIFVALRSDGKISFQKLNESGAVIWRSETQNIGAPSGQIAFCGDKRQFVAHAFGASVLMASLEKDNQPPVAYSRPNDALGGAFPVGDWLMGVARPSALHIINISSNNIITVDLKLRSGLSGMVTGGQNVIYYDNAAGSLNAYELASKETRQNRYRGARLIAGPIIANETLYYIADKDRDSYYAYSLPLGPGMKRSQTIKLGADSPRPEISVSSDVLMIPCYGDKVQLVSLAGFKALAPIATPDGSEVSRPATAIGSTVYLITGNGALIGVEVKR